MRSHIRVIGLALLVSAFSLSSPNLTAKPKPTKNAEALQKLELFADIFARVRSEYVEEVSDKDLIEKALNGALESLDPHSHYVPPTDYEEAQESALREYGGLGIEVTLDKGLVLVNYVNEDGPAYRAGLKKGDYIVAVEGDKVLGKTLNDAVEGMRGLAGDAITITIRTASNDRDISLVREVIRSRAIRHRVEDGLGYVFLETFNNDLLTRDLQRALDALKAEIGGDLPGLIIDLRSNRGGLLDQSVDVSSLFLDGGEVLSARSRKPEDTERYNAEPGQWDSKMPIVVLINSGSASAAEIVAGALQDRGRALVVGRRSFGKGSVQSVIPLSNNNGALRLTTARYYTPSGKSIQGRGIMPDKLVALGPDTGEIVERFREDKLPNALGNSDVSDYQEQYDDIDYPPEGWPVTEDYQIKQAIELLKSPQYRTLLAQYNIRP